jgi:hypothetical protein
VVATRFYPGAQKDLAVSPSKPFGLNSGRQLQMQTALPLLSPRASRLRSPIPALVSKTVTFVTLRLIPKRTFRVNFSRVLFFRKQSGFVDDEKLSVLSKHSMGKNQIPLLKSFFLKSFCFS